MKRGVAATALAALMVNRREEASLGGGAWCLIYGGKLLPTIRLTK